MTCLVPFILAGYLFAGHQSGEAQLCEAGIERPYAFAVTPIRPLSSAFELDTRVYIRSDRASLSLDLWRNPSAGSPRSATGIDLWSMMIGWSF